MIRLNAQLTKRESEIAGLLAWGASKKEVADMLFISTRTVENTARNIYKKTGVQKATELCVFWFCSRCGVKTSLDPLKRAFIAFSLLLIFLPSEILQAQPVYRASQRTRIVRLCTARRRRPEGDTINFKDIRA